MCVFVVTFSENNLCTQDRFAEFIHRVKVYDTRRHVHLNIAIIFLGEVFFDNVRVLQL
jgi:hypothetical protein